MMEQGSEKESKAWKKFLRRHWGATALFVAGAGAALAGAVLVYLWFVGEAQSAGLVPAELSLWSMSYLLTFLLNLAFWELLVVGVPVAVAAVFAYTLWYRRLPAEEKEEYRRAGLFKDRSRGSDAGDGMSFLFFLAFMVIIYLDGYWEVPFSSWTFDYLVYTCLTAVVSVLVIVGIPLAIGGIWWLRREMGSEA